MGAYPIGIPRRLPGASSNVAKPSGWVRSAILLDDEFFAPFD